MRLFKLLYKIPLYIVIMPLRMFFHGLKSLFMSETGLRRVFS